MDNNNQNISSFTNFIMIVKKARLFATKAHEGTYRKGVDENGNKIEYITHPIAVSKILHTYKKSHKIDFLIAACMLHDTVEDVDWVTIDLIRNEFGELIASLVDELTSDPSGLEKFGKEQYLINKMLNMTTWGLGIKLADRIHNLSDIQSKIDSGNKSNIKWAIKYSTQTKNIISALENNRELTNTHKKLIKIIKEKIKPALNYEQ